MRDDQRAMLYPGRDHLVYGPTQSGKTMLALAMCADIICDPVAPGRVLYVHFEEPDGLDTFHRLQTVYTVPNAAIIDHFRFVSPERAARAWEIAELAEDEPELVILDGVNEALTMFGRGDGYSADNWALFRQHLIMPFLRAGSAVVALDHVSRTDGAGYAGPGGSIHKINACTGAAYYLVPQDDADEDHRGCSWVMVTKDRPGGVKRYGIRREGKRGVAPATYWGAMITDARAPNSNPLWIASPKLEHLEEMDGDGD
jgi:RecA-family ATPase